MTPIGDQFLVWRYVCWGVAVVVVAGVVARVWKETR